MEYITNMELSRTVLSIRECNRLKYALKIAMSRVDDPEFDPVHKEYVDLWHKLDKIQDEEIDIQAAICEEQSDSEYEVDLL